MEMFGKTFQLEEIEALHYAISFGNFIFKEKVKEINNTESDMSKEDYQSVLDNIDRRKVDKMREFFKQIPFLKIFPRSLLNTLHLSLTRKRY